MSDDRAKDDHGALHFSLAIQRLRAASADVMPTEEIAARRNADRRLPRQADHFRNLLDHMLHVKNETELRRALHAHFARLQKYYESFQQDTGGVSTSDGDTEDD